MPQAFFIFTTVFTFKFELPTLSDTFAELVAVEQVKRIGGAVARHQGVLETVAVKQLFQRLSLTLMRGNAALVMTRKPDSDLAPAEVDGII